MNLLLKRALFKFS